MIEQCLKKAKLSLAITVIAAGLSSMALCLIPFTEDLVADDRVITYTIAAEFWLGLILILAGARCTKRVLRKYRNQLIQEKRVKKQRLPGIFHFAFGGKHILLYSVIACGMVLMITDIILGYMPEMIMFPIISVTLLSFAIHCVIDGKYYEVYKLIKERVDNETIR